MSLQRDYLNSIKAAAILAWHTHKVLPSITGAQAPLEGDWGRSDLARIHHNHFGIKDSDDWTGRVIPMRTYEWPDGYVIADFRSYDSIEEGFADKAGFFTSIEWRKNNYRAIIGEKDYKKAARALVNAPLPYATDPEYANKLIRIIEEYGLAEWDQEAFSGGVVETIGGTLSPKRVGGTLTEGARAASNGMDITLVADSLGVGTDSYLKAIGWSSYTSDNLGSRQWTHTSPQFNALGVLQTMLNNSLVNSTVIFVLGTNRGVDAHEIKQAVDMLGSQRKIILVDTASEVGHRNKVSEAYLQASEIYSNVYYAPWSETARPNITTWYYADGANGTRIHMTPTGYQQHANFIAQAVYDASLNKTQPPVVVERPTEYAPDDFVNINHIEYEDEDFRKPEGESVIYNDKLNDEFGFKAKNGKRLWVEHYLKVDSEDPDEIFKVGLQYMKEHAKPEAQYIVKLKSLPDTISIGDTGIFVDHDYNPPLYIEARIISITTSDTDENLEQVVLGNVVELFAREKDGILAIQTNLQEVREAMIDEYFDSYHLSTDKGTVIPGTNVLPTKNLARLDSNHLVIGANESVEIQLEDFDIAGGTLYVKGRLEDNYTDDVDGFTPEDKQDEPAVPVDPDTNPQGEPIPDNLTPDIRELKVNEFSIELQTESGMEQTTVPIYQTSEFNLPVSETGEKVNTITINAPEYDLIIDDLEFRFVSDYRNTEQSTTLTIGSTVNNIAIDPSKHVIYWRRVTGDDRLDESWNDANKFNNNVNLTVTPEDLLEGKGTFIAQVYEGDKLIGSDSLVVRNEHNYMPDIIEKATQIVNRDGVTVSFSSVQPENGKNRDVWFKLNEDETQSIMHHDGEGWFETVTNALNADGIMSGTMDFSLVNAIHINAASITAGHGEFLSLALTALNSRATLDGAALRFTNDENGFIEMNAVPEIRSTASDGTSVLLNSGRLHFYDSLGMSKGYFGTDIHDGTRDFGTFLSKGSGTYRFARMAEAQSTQGKYYIVQPGDGRVSVITNLVLRGDLPDGDGADFVRKSNMIARLNGWAPLPQEWPALTAGQQIKFQEETITGGETVDIPQYYTVVSGDSWWGIHSKTGVPLQELYDLNNADASTVIHAGDQILIGYETVVGGGDAYDNIYRIGTSTQGDWRFYHDKYVVFEGGTSLSSDRRIKENIEDTAVIALDHIDDFSFKQFDKIKTGVHTDLGMIAQESGILRVADDEIEGIDLEGSIMLALKGVQELHQVIKKQQEKIDLLEERLNEKG